MLPGRPNDVVFCSIWPQHAHCKSMSPNTEHRWRRSGCAEISNRLGRKKRTGRSWPAGHRSHPLWREEENEENKNLLAACLTTQLSLPARAGLSIPEVPHFSDEAPRKKPGDRNVGSFESCSYSTTRIPYVHQWKEEHARPVKAQLLAGGSSRQWQTGGCCRRKSITEGDGGRGRECGS